MSAAMPSTTHTPTQTADLRPRVDHLGGVDWLRIIGITGVAYFHTAEFYPDAPGQGIGFAGLHALTAAAAYFAAVSRSGTSDRDIIVKRFHRLIIPFLIFSLPFMAKAIQSGKFQWWMLWMGGSQHLWFLPFIFVVSCAIAMSRRRGMIRQGTGSALFWTVLATALTAIEPHLSARMSPDGPLQVVNALPSVLWGLAVFAAPRGAWALVQVTLMALAGASAMHWQPAVPPFWPGAVAIGCIAFVVARSLPIQASAASRFLGRTSFGVYLLHALALTVVIRLLARLTQSPDGAMASDPYGIMILGQVVLAIVGCIVAVAILEKTPLRRFIA